MRALLRRGPRRAARRAPPSCAHGGAGALRAPYARERTARRLLEERGARVEETLFGAEVEIVFSAPETQSESVVTLLRDATAGEAEVRLGESVFRPEREKE